MLFKNFFSVAFHIFKGLHQYYILFLTMSQSSSFELPIFYIGGVLVENAKVRVAARIAGVPLWKIAKQIGISEPTLTRWLRIPLSAEREMLIMTAIENLAKGA